MMDRDKRLTGHERGQSVRTHLLSDIPDPNSYYRTKYTPPKASTSAACGIQNESITHRTMSYTDFFALALPISCKPLYVACPQIMRKLAAMWYSMYRFQNPGVSTRHLVLQPRPDFLHHGSIRPLQFEHAFVHKSVLLPRKSRAQ